ncbi:MAG TPA: hypothetical protein VMB49_21310 [Acidobacteriaceae bacterium]|nr:hypothetical protein [Acidobacteriaceae bacterium]
MRIFLFPRFLSICALAALIVAMSSATLAAQNTKGLRLQENFSPGSLDQLEMPFPEDWEILKDGELPYLHMLRPRDPGVPRRPLQFARLKGVRVGSFTLDVKVRRERRSMIVVFGYVDTLHFYYAHLSGDTGAKVAVHNGIFIVDGAERRRIAGLTAPPALPDQSWHDVRIVRDVASGSIQVFVDEQKTPLFSVVDHTFPCGQIGLGSFDETGDFARLRLRASRARCTSTENSK